MYHPSTVTFKREWTHIVAIAPDSLLRESTICSFCRKDRQKSWASFYSPGFVLIFLNTETFALLTFPIAIYSLLLCTDGLRLPSLVRVLSNRPDLGQHMRRVYCTSDTIGDILQISENDWDLCKALRLSCGFALDGTGIEVSKWAEDIVREIWDANFAQLLCQLPQIETLILDHDSLYTPNSGSFKYLLAVLIAAQSSRTAVPSPNLLSKLKHVSIYNHHGLELGEVVPFAALDWLESLHLKCLGMARHGNEDLASFHHQQFRTKELHLDDCIIGGNYLARFLSQFTHLQYLKYSHSMYDLEAADFLPRYLTKGIAHLKSCLESLEIYASPRYNCFRPIEQLKEFEVLKHITLDQNILPIPYDIEESDTESESESEYESDKEETEHCTDLLVNFLPRSIRTLTIMDAQKKFLHQIPPLIKRKMELVPALEKISIEIRYPGNEGKLLKEECLMVGIELNFYVD